MNQCINDLIREDLKKNGKLYRIFERGKNMKVCEFCGDEDIAYEDNDGIEQYCEECYKELKEEYIEFNGIRRI